MMRNTETFDRAVTEPGTPARSFGAPSRQATVAAVLIGLAVILSFIHSQWRGYGEAVAHAERDTRNTAELLAVSAARTFEGIALTLRAVGRLRNDAARGIYRSQDSIYVHLRTLHGGSPIMDEIGWFDAYGVRAATSAMVDPLRTSAANEEFFRVHREGRSAADLHVSVPIVLPEVDERRIPVSLRLENLDGSFAGVAMGTIDPKQFTRVHRSLDLGSQHTTILVRRDGIVLAWMPDGDAFPGRSIAGGALARDHLPRAAHGSYHASADSEGPSRIGSYASIAGTGGSLAIGVSVPRAEALADFWRDLAFGSLLVGFALAILSVGTYLLVAGLQRRERLQAELATATETANDARAEAETARAAAETANRAKSEFLARMSHELRTPLNAVIGFAQILELDHTRTLAQRQKEYSQHIHEAGDHLLKLVNEVLDLAGVESGRLSVSLERVDVAEALAGIVDIMTPVAVKADVTLICDPAPAGLKVRADVQRLRQVLINLVGNAIKYNHPGGFVTLSAMTCSGGRLRLAVADTGRGIPAERRAHLFEPFHRLGAEYTAVEGTGLGLALAKRLVEAMDGAIDYESETELGSTFWVELGRDVAEAVRPGAVDGSPSTATASSTELRKVGPARRVYQPERAVRAIAGD